VLIVLGFVIAAAGGWFLVIGPQRSKSADLDHQIADTQSAIDAAQALTLEAKKGAKIRVADLYRLTKAMPDQVDMPGILLELNQVAADSGISFEQITPSTTATPISGYLAIPITVEFQGNFYDLSDFLYRLRNLVDVRQGTLDATGGCSPSTRSTSPRRRRRRASRRSGRTSSSTRSSSAPAPRRRSPPRPGRPALTGPPARRARPARRLRLLPLLQLLRLRPRQARPRREPDGEEDRSQGEGQEAEDLRRDRRRDPARPARVPGAADDEDAAPADESSLQLGAGGHDGACDVADRRSVTRWWERDRRCGADRRGWSRGRRRSASRAVRAAARVRALPDEGSVQAAARAERRQRLGGRDSAGGRGRHGRDRAEAASASC
jgi:hypothetical protein